MSFVLFKTTFKKNWGLLVIFFSVLTMYTTIMISMYNPNDMEMLNNMLDLFPQDLMRVMGFSNIITDLTGYLASWLYGFLMLAFPMVYSIILSNRLVAKMVDNSSFSYLLSTPNSRIKIIFTQGMYALISLAVLFLSLFSLGVVISGIMFPGQLNIQAFYKLNFTTMLVGMVVIMISFFFSSLFNDTKYSLGFGAGIPIMFLLMNMLGGVSKEAEFIKKISIFGIYNPVEVVNNGDILYVNILFVLLIILLFTASIYIFNKKRLPL